MDDFILLNNKLKMPSIGYGVYKILPIFTEKCVLQAIDTGYRLIDTAQCYGNEKAVGNAVRKSGIDRQEFFITTKLWNCRGYKDTKESITNSLKRLNLNYIDLLLIHEPTGNYIDTYKVMEEFYNMGLLKAIGVANFLEDTFINLIEQIDIIPVVNQVETHVFRQQHQLHKLLKNYHVQLESWSPLACGKNNFFHNSLLRKLAEKYSKSVAQIGLKFLHQQNIIVIPKSTHLERMIENRNILDFTLSDDDMLELQQLDEDRSLFNWW